MSLTGWDRHTAIGFLVILWHDSQDALLIKASKEEICRCIDHPETDKILGHLVASGYIKKHDDDTFEVRGNCKHVTAHKVRLTRAIKGGVASSKKRSKKLNDSNKIELEVDPSSNEFNLTQLQVQQKVPNAIQCNSMQFNSNTNSLTRMRPNKSPPVREELGYKVQTVVKTYCAAFKEKYGAQPHIEPKHLGLIKTQLKAHSVEKLCEMVQVFLQMQNPFFQKRKHDLTTFCSNLNEISVARQTGVDSGAPKDPFEFLNKKQPEVAR